VSSSELQIEVERLRRELAKRDIRIAELEAMLMDRDATIARISRDLAKLQALVNPDLLTYPLPAQ
jgi:predicted RNase H-like nuclease (RuvC/YqgF family)